MSTTSFILLSGAASLVLVQCGLSFGAGAIADEEPAFRDYSKSNAVSIVLGQDAPGQGLEHIDRQADGRTIVEGIDGLPARKISLKGTRNTVYMYFAIDPTFKDQDVRRVRIEFEYVAPSGGNMGVHYDGFNPERGEEEKYSEANRPMALSRSGQWQKAVFYTKNDAEFKNRENGGSDFRIWARTPTLYVRTVTVTRDPLNEGWSNDFSKSNRVSILLGQKNPADGLRHLTDEKDGQAIATKLGDEPCSYLTRMQEGRPYGSFYFQINPSFKSGGTKNVTVEIEYLSQIATGMRLQYDGSEGGLPVRYLPALAEGASVMRYPTGADYGNIPRLGTWQTATFHLTNAVLQNSQKGGADFRLEVVPPDLYIRRVTVIRNAK